MLTLEKMPGYYKVHYQSNGVFLGEFYPLEDGFYVFDPNPGGVWTAELFSAVAEELNKLNRPLQEELEAFFNKEKEKEKEEKEREQKKEKE